VFSLLLILSACAQSASTGRIKAGVDLPPLPGQLRASCPDPGVRDGKDARIELARTRKALATCARRKNGVVSFYDQARKEFDK